MSNIFDWTVEEQKAFEEENLRCKKEFESLNLDFYKENPVEDWYTFISHLEHYNKSWGSSKFIYDYITVDKLESWGKERRCYTLGYVLYLCNKFNITKPDYLNYYKDERLDKILFDKSSLDDYNSCLFCSILNVYKNCIPELMNYNIYCSEIEVVVSGS